MRNSLFSLAFLAVFLFSCGSIVSPTPLPSPSASPSPLGVAAPATQIPLPTNSPAASPTSTVHPFYQPGDVLTFDDFALVVLGWRNMPPSATQRPPFTRKYIAVELLALNTSAVEAKISSAFMPGIVDGDGNQYVVSYSGQLLAGHLLSGNLLPGERMDGDIAFEVPEQIKGMKFHLVSTNKFREYAVELPDEPVGVSAPTSLAGERKVKCRTLGETVTLSEGISTAFEAVSHPALETVRAVPESGMTFLSVTLDLANVAKDPFRFSPVDSIYLKDQNGRVYYQMPKALGIIPAASTDSSIAPGQHLRETYYFQVPQGEMTLELVVDPFVYGPGQGKAFFVLGS